jgi:hydroxymethylbilane synthase
VKVTIGSRGSALALWQAGHVKDRLAALGHDVMIRTITTTGDRVLDRRLESVGGKGAFLKEIEEALLAREVDLAVHSLKDVPTKLPDGLTLCAFLERGDPRDALLSANGRRLVDLPPRSRVGTTSLRRSAQIKALRPDLHILDLRGNVDTRIRRLRDGAFEAIVLAMAGLVRLGRSEEVAEALDPTRFTPAPGQGVVVLECRAGDDRVREAVHPLHHPSSCDAVEAERALLARLSGSCNVPLGAFAVREGAGWRLRAFVARPDGSQILRGEKTGAIPAELGRDLADDLLDRGGRAILGL